MTRDRFEEARLFDAWAARYDEAVRSGQGFPFAGYAATLDRVAALACAKSGMRVLDLGIGTGNLARRFVGLGCDVWGTDISSKMLALAQAKVPRVHLVQADMAGVWPPALPERFDRVVSAYVFHHFKLATKVDLLLHLLRDHCAADGLVVVGDICLATAKELLAARREWGHLMDPEEHYWIADEAIAACERAGLRVQYEQVSAFAGVFILEDGSGTAAQRA